MQLCNKFLSVLLKGDVNHEINIFVNSALQGFAVLM